jgi:hypothetical protein
VRNAHFFSVTLDSVKYFNGHNRIVCSSKLAKTLKLYRKAWIAKVSFENSSFAIQSSCNRNSQFGNIFSVS